MCEEGGGEEEGGNKPAWYTPLEILVKHPPLLLCSSSSLTHPSAPPSHSQALEAVGAAGQKAYDAAKGLALGGMDGASDAAGKCWVLRTAHVLIVLHGNI